MNLTVRILIGMGAGILLGLLIQFLGLPVEHWLRALVVDGVIDAGGEIFIRSLKLMVVPLVFISLVCGAASLGGHGNMGRVGGKTIGLYLLTTGLAITIALVLALIVGPGRGAAAIDLPAEVYEPAPPVSVKDTLVNIFPTNPVEAMAQGNMLQIIVFALLLGVALSRTGAAGERVTGVFNDLNAVMMKLITMLIQLAPVGVFCLMTTLFSNVGWSEILKLIKYFMTVIVALILHAALVYPTLLVLLARVSPVTFFLKMREPMLVAFSTASSGATLPVTLRTVEQRLGVKNEIAAFSIDLGVADYLMVILTATMASVGTAGVPGVGLIMLVMVLTQVGLPAEGIMLIIGVDRLLDMLRTSVNVSGDGMVSTVVARSENDLDLAVLRDPAAGAVIEPRAA